LDYQTLEQPLNEGWLNNLPDDARGWWWIRIRNGNCSFQCWWNTLDHEQLLTHFLLPREYCESTLTLNMSFWTSDHPQGLQWVAWKYYL
jgi:hypothetical protein